MGTHGLRHVLYLKILVPSGPNCFQMFPSQPGRTVGTPGFLLHDLISYAFFQIEEGGGETNYFSKSVGRRFDYATLKVRLDLRN